MGGGCRIKGTEGGCVSLGSPQGKRAIASPVRSSPVGADSDDLWHPNASVCVYNLGGAKVFEKQHDRLKAAYNAFCHLRHTIPMTVGRGGLSACGRMRSCDPSLG